MDEAERRPGSQGGTPRTIEGPLYVAGAPLSQGRGAARRRHASRARSLFMEGQVRDTDGRPVAGAIVDVWHANTLGGYSSSTRRRALQPAPAHRDRRRGPLPLPQHPALGLRLPAGRADAAAARPRSAGTATARRTSTSSSTAPGFRKLTTQINIAGDPYLHDDFAFATRDGLIPELVRHTDPAEIKDARPERAVRRDHLRLRAEP